METNLARTLAADTANMVGQRIRLCGWVQTVRSHGKIIFFDLRDRSGIMQTVIIPKMDFFEQAKEVRSEWVVELTGTVNERPQDMINEKITTGKVELFVEELRVLSKAETLPISIDTDGYDISEDNRLKYRYLDLRRARLRRNLMIRHKTINFIRQFLTNEGFLEVETPILTRSTPEGARDFLVPSRLQPGKFYALPQSPQQYKQLLMVAGLERYFQIARCVRDEDTRGDRQPEFTQLDLEMSFTTEDEVMCLNEELLIAIIKEICPQKTIQDIPFPRMTHKETVEKYGSDRPDLRKDRNNPDLLAFCWITDFPFFEKTPEDGWTFTHNPFSAPKAEFMDDLIAKKNIAGIIAAQYDVVLNGEEIGGGSIRNHRSQSLEAVFQIMGFEKAAVRENFNHMLKAFSFGAPPHGGIAWGLERLLAVMQNEPNIREVMAFPKTGDNRDLMLDAPAAVSEQQLKELGIAVAKKGKNNPV
jgi:aspartyl-tRNA synthetase